MKLRSVPGDARSGAARAAIAARQASAKSGRGKFEHLRPVDVPGLPGQEFYVDEYGEGATAGYLVREIRRTSKGPKVRITNHGPGPFADDTGWLDHDED